MLSVRLARIVEPEQGPVAHVGYVQGL